MIDALELFDAFAVVVPGAAVHFIGRKKGTPKSFRSRQSFSAEVETPRIFAASLVLMRSGNELQRAP